MTNAPCRDQARSLFFDRLGQFVLREEPTIIGQCSICGAKGVEVASSDLAKPGPCRAQVAITQKRHTIVDGHPMAFGSPVLNPEKRGFFAISDISVALLITPDRALAVSKVAPTKELPKDVQIIRPKTGVDFTGILEEVMTNPKPPFLLALFNQKADMPMRISRSTSEIIINGTPMPVRLDRARLQTLVALFEEFGIRAVQKAAELKAIWSSADPLSLRKEFGKLKETTPDLVERFADLPAGQEPELEYAVKIAKRRLDTAEALAA